MDEILVELREKYKDRHVVVAWPSAEHIDCRFSDSLLELVAQNLSVFNLGLAHTISSRITVNRNQAVEKARSLGATDILFIDADSRFPANGLLQLIKHDLDIVGATTCRRNEERVPVGVPMEGALQAPLMEMRMMGFPFMLIKMHVFDALQKPYFAEPPRRLIPAMNLVSDEVVGEDEYWCHNVRAAGFKIWCDMRLSTEIGHIGTDVKYIAQEHVHYLESVKTTEAL